MDYLEGGGGSDVLDGGAGVDTLFGGAGADQLHGGSEADLLIGGKDDDRLEGGTGRDTYVIGSGRDTILDTDGDGIVKDRTGRLIAGQFVKQGSEYVWIADETVTGTKSSPLTLTFADGASVVIEDFESGDFGIDLRDAPLTPTSTLTGTDFAENRFDADLSHGDLAGTPAAERILGLGGGDVLLAQAGDDSLEGGTGVDTLDGGLDDDVLYAEAEIDWALAIGAAATGSTVTGDDWLNGGAGEDILVGSSADEQLSGGGGQDLLIGSAGSDWILGDQDWLPNGLGWSVSYDPSTGEFHFTASGGLAADGAGDTIYAGADLDVVFGQSGDDVIYGGGETDYLWGDSGADTLLGEGANDYLNGDSDPRHYGSRTHPGGCDCTKIALWRGARRISSIAWKATCR